MCLEVLHSRVGFSTAIILGVEKVRVYGHGTRKGIDFSDSVRGEKFWFKTVTLRVCDQVTLLGMCAASLLCESGCGLSAGTGP